MKRKSIRRVDKAFSRWVHFVEILETHRKLTSVPFIYDSQILLRTLSIVNWHGFISFRAQKEHEAKNSTLPKALQIKAHVFMQNMSMMSSEEKASLFLNWKPIAHGPRYFMVKWIMRIVKVRGNKCGIENQKSKVRTEDKT